jgi:hypothetical protein
MSKAKFEEFEDFGRVLKERSHLDLIRSCLGDKWQILEMYIRVIIMWIYIPRA